MNRDPKSCIAAVLDDLPAVRVPYQWFRTIANHTALLLLADILAAYQAGSETFLRRGSGWMMGGDELLLPPYQHLATKFQVSERTISRAMDFLADLKAIRRSCRDRVIRDKRRRNVVGVFPDLQVIGRLSGLDLSDILASPLNVLTPFRESVSRAFRDYFEDNLGQPYRPSVTQLVSDRRALNKITPTTERGGGRKYIEWARQYIEALRAKDQKEHGSPMPVARNGYARNPYTLEDYVDWALTNSPLPNGYGRR